VEGSPHITPTRFVKHHKALSWKEHMMELLYLGLLVLFFGLSLGLITWCDHR